MCCFAAIGFNVETVTYKNLKFQVWDLGGQTSIRFVFLLFSGYKVVSCSSGFFTWHAALYGIQSL